VTEVVLGADLRPADVERVAGGAPVSFDPVAVERVVRSRAALDRLIESDAPLYGITTGFGALVTEKVEKPLQRELQVNLLRSHAAGHGVDLPREVVRAALAVRLSSLLRGYSGIRPETLELIAAFLNADLVPRVPRSGSLGASGDLAPSAHAFLPLIGEGEVTAPDGETIPGAEALRRLGREPLELAPKEGLALINGTHFMAGIGALLVGRVHALADAADVAAALAIVALRGASAAFDERVHLLRPYEGQLASAANVRALLAEQGRANGRWLQDAYSLRCAAQVHGAAREGLAFFERIVSVDLTSVTDNPIVFPDPVEVVSAGNFHGQSLALAFDTLRLVLADLGAISERRTFRLVSPSLNGELPPFLTARPGVSSGYMIVQYTAAALVAELRALAHPVSVDNVPTSDNQEDHVSMGMTGALLSLDAAERLETVIASELLCACQALEFHRVPAEAPLGAVHAVVRERVAPLDADRPPSPDVAALADLVRSRKLSAILADAVMAAEAR
jgi:histidine ammonia-lyase